MRSLSPDGVDTVLDAVGGTVFAQGLELVKPLGTMVSYGAITTEVPTVPVLGLQLRSLTGFSFYGWQQARPDEARADIAEVIRRWQTGELRPVVHATHPLTDVARIHETLDARANLGRLIAVP